MSFKVISRKICDCGQPVTLKRFRRFCSKECRDKSYANKYRAYRSEWQRKYQDKKHLQSSANKKKCLICARWYVQVGTHIVQRHGLTAREYREQYGLPLKRGIVAQSYRERKGDKVFENGTVENLKQGRRYWFKKNDPRATIEAGGVGWKSKRRVPDEYYE